jgi:predicted O-methyltransferase YrrM
MDIDKVGYPDALPVIREKLRPGGVLIIDNMLWSGRLWNEKDNEPETEAIRRTARTIADDPAWTQVIVPLRDGILVARLEG